MDNNMTVIPIDGELGAKLAEAHAKLNPPPTPPTNDTPPTPTNDTTPPADVPPTPPADVTPPTEPTQTPTDVPTDDLPPLFNVLTSKVEPTSTEVPPTTPVTPTELPQDIQQKLEEYEQLVALRQLVEQNPFFKAAQIGVEPEKFEQIIKEMIPEDKSNLPLKDLIEMDIKNTYKVEGAILEEAVAETLAKYEEGSTFAKIQMEKDLRDKFKPKSGLNDSPTLKEYQRLWEEAQKNTQPQADPQEIQKIIDADLSSIKQTLTQKYVNQEFYGFKITEDVAKGIMDYYNENTIQPYLREDKSSGRIIFDQENFVKDTFMMKYGAQLLDAAIKHGSKIAKKEFANPDPNTNGGTPSSIQNGKSPQELAKEALRDAVLRGDTSILR